MFEEYLEKRNSVDTLLMGYIQKNSMVKHPFAGYALGVSQKQNLVYLMDALLTSLEDEVSINYIRNKYAVGKLDHRYFAEEYLPVDNQSSHRTTDMWSVRVCSEWAEE